MLRKKWKVLIMLMGFVTDRGEAAIRTS